ncbi:MAG: 3-deoxy-8-phosphooctulonate synthase [Elusimicrobia bacterium]|nr:3-deoxy-8-phosphooctulonate synthase [Elusimicrobiota bacterium]
MKEKTVSLKSFDINLANNLPLILVAGPCVIENEKSILKTAKELKRISQDFDIPLIFKASYDKANRTSLKSFRGPGLKKGLEILSRVKKEYLLPILTDVHCENEVKYASKVADILQIPAFLCRQTDLILECAKTKLPVNVKKGQFLAPEDIFHVVEKIESQKNHNIILTERGTSFGYHNLVVDMRSIAIMKKTLYPVIFDATHSVQLPGGLKKSSGGQKEFVETLSRSAVSLGISGIFVEVHENPSKALSDASNSLSFEELKKLIPVLKGIDGLVKSSDKG